MAIKSVKSDPQPDIIHISHNASDRMLDAVIKEINTKWGKLKIIKIINNQMPLNTLIIYDKYDQILVKYEGETIKYITITKGQRDAAMLKSSGGVFNSFYAEEN